MTVFQYYNCIDSSEKSDIADTIYCIPRSGADLGGGGAPGTRPPVQSHNDKGGGTFSSRSFSTDC